MVSFRSMSMKKKSCCNLVLAVSLSLLIVAANVTSVFASQVTDHLRTTIDKVIDIVSNSKYKNDKKARRKLIREIINPLFSYEQMSMRSLAKNWKKRTDEEKKDFIELFGRLLENSYASKIESFSDEIINYVDEKIKGKYALVKTEIVRKDGVIDVDYKLINHNGNWKVYDFVIEGVSMIKNYRSQFSRIIKKESYEALRKRLNDKVIDLES